MAKKVANNKEDDSKLFAFLAILLSIIGFIIAYAAKKDNKYVMFYAKQSLVLFFGWLIVWAASLILMHVPFIGNVIIGIANIGLLILWVFGLIYSLSGEMKDIPFVSQFTGMINL